MFHLETSILEWRQKMLAAGVKAPVPLDELEAHLRDEIAGQMKSGVTAENAFNHAIQKIGGAIALKNEFQKNQPSFAQKLERRLPLIIATAVPAMLACDVLFKVGNLAELNPAQRLSSLAAVALVPALTWGGWFAYRCFPVVPAGHTRNAILGYCAALLALWWTAFFFLILPRYDFNIAQLCVAILWGFVAPTGILAGLTSGIEKSSMHGSRPWKRGRALSN